MSKQEKTMIGEADTGDVGMPGSEYTQRIARVYRLWRGYELHVRRAHGSNQGRLEEHGRVDRHYRAATIDELRRVGISEIRGDDEMRDVASSLGEAIRLATAEAEDAEAEDPPRTAAAS